MPKWWKKWRVSASIWTLASNNLRTTVAATAFLHWKKRYLVSLCKQSITFSLVAFFIQVVSLLLLIRWTFSSSDEINEHYEYKTACTSVPTAQRNIQQIKYKDIIFVLYLITSVLSVLFSTDVSRCNLNIPYTASGGVSASGLWGVYNGCEEITNNDKVDNKVVVGVYVAAVSSCRFGIKTSHCIARAQQRGPEADRDD